MLSEKISVLKKTVLERLHAISYEELIQYEFTILGRKGDFTVLAKELKLLPQSARKSAGQLINDVKKELTETFAKRKKEFEGEQSATGDVFDVTLPGLPARIGHLHPVTQAIEEIDSIFTQLGFGRVRYNEIEWDHYAFEVLNMPKDHPARDEWETFFISDKEVGPLGKIILTPHTSSGQVREMKKYSKKGLPIRMLNIAKTYRRQIDISHLPMFHQFEGLVIDTGVTLTQLTGTLNYFVKNFFSADRTVRLRPWHFRFTEPSFEVDISCGLCGGKGCATCKEGWVELAGGGMVHPNVLRAGGYDPEVYTGFAFGFGVERCYLMKNNLNIGDLRLLYSNDIRFLEQF